MSILKLSKSPYSTPLVMIKKSDNAHRICLDFRRLNSVTVLDSEAMPDPESIFAAVGGKTFFFKKQICIRLLADALRGRQQTVYLVYH